VCTSISTLVTALSEVDRLVGLGATVVHDKHEWGITWTTLTDPEGNEFCVAKH
jgi:predicted enzyme related to lactoylglutathione lyase